MRSEEGSSNIGWLTVVAIAFGGCNLSYFLFGSLFTKQGTISVSLLIIGSLISYLAAPGWLKLILSAPSRVGGIAAVTAVTLRPYSQILGTIIGVGYWLAWTCAASFSALFFATTLHNWLLPFVSINFIAVLLLILVTCMALLGLRWLSRIVVPLAIITFILTIISIVVPVYSGQVNWSIAFDHEIHVPFPGWFGVLTSIMAGLYYVGWIAPAYEASLCFMGEMKDKNKGIKRALSTSLVIIALYCIAMPVIWLGVMGSEALKSDLVSIDNLNNIFLAFGHGTANALAIAFLMLNTLLSTITPLCTTPRTLAQLADDGFIPKIFAKRIQKTQVPYAATLITSAIAIFILLYATEGWLIAATDFEYLICIAIASVSACLVIKTQPESAKNINKLFVYCGFIPAFIWTLATIFGFQQFGLPTVVLGIAFAFSGSIFLVWRKVHDGYNLRQPIYISSLQNKFLGTMFIILILDSIGYLIAVQYIIQLQVFTPLIVILEDIFVVVALITISVGLVIPGTIVTAAVNLSDAAKHLAKGTMQDFSNAMTALGKGELEKASVKINVDLLPIISHDEIGTMTEDFNQLQREIYRSADGLKGAREKLILARKELIEINEQLERRVQERTKELSATNITLQKTLDDLTHTQEKLIESRKISFLEELVKGITNEISEPVGVSVSAISQLKDELETCLTRFKVHQLTESQLDSFLNLSKELIRLSEKNVKRTVEMLDKFKQISIDQSSELPQDTREFYLKEYLEFIIMSLKFSTSKTNIDISIDCPPTLKIQSYPGILFQIISIFISNSIMHGFNENEAGKILIQVTTDHDKVILKYSDNGKGISPENFKKIFQPFFTTKRGKGFLGLGLHIIQSNIMRLLNGTISCESKPGKGTTFTVIFPAKLSDG